MKRIVSFILVLVLGLLIISGCSGSSKLVGTWITENSDAPVFVFYDDGTYVWISWRDGEYKIDGNTLHLKQTYTSNRGGGVDNYFYNFEISGDKLTLTWQSGATDYNHSGTYIRLK
ncbi:MAG: hypothetical protein FWE74_05965 [Oscillospiraceae bacterium]|nr:hypothetical protein [Oscillospiraceae bacterium]